MGHTYEKLDGSAILGIVLGTVVPIVVVLVCITICCVVPCCLCYKYCRKPRNQRQIVVTNNVTNMPQPPHSPSGYQASVPGYQAVPHEDSQLPSAPPPSYMECIGASYPPAPFQAGQVMYPLTPPNQPGAPPLPPDEVVQPPFNPSYVPQL